MLDEVKDKMKNIPNEKFIDSFKNYEKEFSHPDFLDLTDLYLSE